MKNPILFILGFLLVALGLGLIIKNWEVLSMIFKGFIGLILALVGLVLMFSSGIRR